MKYRIFDTEKQPFVDCIDYEITFHGVQYNTQKPRPSEDGQCPTGEYITGFIPHGNFSFITPLHLCTKQ